MPSLPKPDAERRRIKSSSSLQTGRPPAVEGSTGPDRAGPPPDNTDPGEELRRGLLDAVDKLSRVVDAAVHEASGEIVRRAAGELPGAVDRLVLQRHWWIMVRAGAAVVLSALVGAGMMWLALTGGNLLTCTDQANGRVCYYWANRANP